MPHNIYYNYAISTKVFFYNQAIGGFGRGTVSQVEIDLYISDLTLTQQTEYILLLSNGGSTTKEESLLFYDINGGNTIPQSVVTVNFLPGDKVWVTDSCNNNITYATIASIQIKIHQSYITKEYLVNYESEDCHVCETSERVNEEELFATAYDALLSLGLPLPAPSSIPPTSTPTSSVPTPSPTPTPPPSGDCCGDTIISKVNGSIYLLTKAMAVSVDSVGSVFPSGYDTRALSFLGFVYDDTIPVNGAGRIILEGTINNTNAGWNDVIVESGLLQIGKKYYLGDDGKITAYPPSSGYSKQIGFATSQNTLDIRIAPSIKI